MQRQETIQSRNATAAPTVPFSPGTCARRQSLSPRPGGQRTRRRGWVLVAAIVCTAVASVIFMSILRLLAAERRATQTDQWQVQAAWLAESGIERAANRLSGDPKYSGETWKLPAGAFAARAGAAVKIEVQPIPEQPGQRLIRVQADYPDDPQHRVRQTRQAVVPVRPARS